MIRHLGKVLPLVLIGGCAIEEERFRAQADEAVCTWKAECFPQYGTRRDCLDAAEEDWSPPGDECLYDGGMARTCLTGLRQLECPITGSAPAFPSACDAVWDCSG